MEYEACIQAKNRLILRLIGLSAMGNGENDNVVLLQRYEHTIWSDPETVCRPRRSFLQRSREIKRIVLTGIPLHLVEDARFNVLRK